LEIPVTDATTSPTTQPEPTREELIAQRDLLDRAPDDAVAAYIKAETDARDAALRAGRELGFTGDQLGEFEARFLLWRAVHLIDEAAEEMESDPGLAVERLVDHPVHGWSIESLRRFAQELLAMAAKSDPDVVELRGAGIPRVAVGQWSDRDAGRTFGGPTLVLDGGDECVPLSIAESRALAAELLATADQVAALYH
jgi:hypothetical protein